MNDDDDDEDDDVALIMLMMMTVIIEMQGLIINRITHTHTHIHLENMHITQYKEDEIRELTVPDLKKIITDSGNSTAGCFEKSELVDLAIKLRNTLPPPVDLKALARQDVDTIRNEKVDYYEVLAVVKTATTSEIQKAYYKLAKEYHPDKNRNDAHAEEMFKKISEAYQVLSDPEKRKKYDQFGFDAMNESMIDPLELFRLIFGGAQFQNFFGDLSFYDLFAQQFDPNNPEEFKQPDPEEIEKKQKIRIDELSKQLVILIEPYVQGNKKEFTDMITEKAGEMALTPGGPELLSLLGYIYVQEAKQHSTFGFIYEISEKGHKASEFYSTIKSAFKMQSQVQNMAQNENQGEVPPEGLLKEGLKLIWKIGRLDIDSAVREVCERAMDKKKIAKDERKHRVEAIKLLGQIFEKKGAEHKGKSGPEDIFNLAAQAEHPNPTSPNSSTTSPRATTSSTTSPRTTTTTSSTTTSSTTTNTTSSH
ncbi:DNAJ heat shock N-terminal domain-containing protein [Cavenderia fasciculata]|uniref:DNAJ heat shock N-terminal domain-containing protein n=1 Tax=Cavenderia fasciculata TaxID=261658 RepID=F4PJI7_CACFS|nr:DNAJ heat shock N-terminal domain-containing protein [Cavenderia fasciculata]EGG23761.1 DNAJ heat shock N-terminal domain-containing protein [Cavenderia fasciculata]|eukprot:XP_004361612.1 DNAJ heat shock N-terminal domain-containing protein [Cavenderia fasciculata]